MVTVEKALGRLRDGVMYQSSRGYLWIRSLPHGRLAIRLEAYPAKGNRKTVSILDVDQMEEFISIGRGIDYVKESLKTLVYAATREDLVISSEGGWGQQPLSWLREEVLSCGVAGLSFTDLEKAVKAGILREACR